MILLITDSSSRHADQLEIGLTKIEAEFRRIDTDQLLSSTFFEHVSINNRPKSSIYISNIEVPLSDVGVIWWFNYQAPVTALSAEKPWIRNWIENESEIAFRSILYSLDVQIVNHPLTVLSANNKMVQYRLADRLGFYVPDTIISSSKKRIVRFLSNHKSCIFKTLSHPTREDADQESVIYTSRVVPDHVEASDNLEVCPNLFQEEILKQYELRVTVVATEVFAVRIYSQLSPATSIDWRRYDIPNTPHEWVQLPEQVENACRELTSQLGLYYSTIDLIVDHENRYWFIELNPNGLWLWLEMLTGVPVSVSLARYLFNVDVGKID